MTCVRRRLIEWQSLFNLIAGVVTLTFYMCYKIVHGRNTYCTHHFLFLSSRAVRNPILPLVAASSYLNRTRDRIAKPRLARCPIGLNFEGIFAIFKALDRQKKHFSAQSSRFIWFICIIFWDCPNIVVLSKFLWNETRGNGSIDRRRRQWFNTTMWAWAHSYGFDFAAGMLWHFHKCLVFKGMFSL